VWASNVSSFFGYKAATLQNGVARRVQRTRVDYAYPSRYWSLRSYRPDARLRLDSLRFYGHDQTSTPSASAARRLSDHANHDDEEAERLAIWTLFFKNLSYPVPASREQLLSIIKHFFAQHPTTEHLARTNASEWPQRPAEPSWADDVPAFDMASLNWWNNIEVHTLDTDASGVFNLYPLRLIPNTASISPAASLVTALALTNSSESGEPDAFDAASRLFASACRRMGGCAYQSREAPFLNSVFEFDHPRVSLVRDDGEWAAWLLSATVAPVVHAIVTKSLMCATRVLCGELCAVCDGILPPERAVDLSPTDVVRSVEAALVGGPAGNSVDVATCVEALACVADVAERAAAELQTIALPMGPAIEPITRANKRLWDAMRDAVTENATSYSNLTDVLTAAMEVHFATVGNHPPPDWARRDAAASGRRLQEQGKRSAILSSASGVDFGVNETKFAEWYARLNGQERLLFATSATAAHELMHGAEHTVVVRAHMQVLRVWASVGSHIGTGGNYTGVCADPHIPNRTIACRAYFALMGKEVQQGKRRKDEERAFEATGKRFDRRRLTRDHRRQLEESVEAHLDTVCCAEFESDGRVECGRRFCEHHVMRNTLRRMGHILHRLSQDERHPVQKKLTPDVLSTLENYVLPELHGDPRCRQINRSTLEVGGPTRWECMGKSLLTHAAKKHGLDAKTVEKHMKTMGLSIGTAMQSVHKAAGVIREVRGAGNVAKRMTTAASKRRSEGAKRAADLIRAAEEEETGGGRRLSVHREDRALQDEDGLSDDELARQRAVTRGTVALPGTRFRGFGHAARRVAAARRELRNVSRSVHDQFGRLEEREHRDRLERASRGRTAHARRDVAPRYDRFHWDNFKQHVVNPLFAFEVLQAEHGSISSRLRSGLSKLATLSERWSALHVEASLLDVRRRRHRQRRLSESSESSESGNGHADGADLEDRRSLVRKLYAEIERRQEKRAAEHRRRLEEETRLEDGRRLSEDEIRARMTTPTLELPERHTFSFLHEMVDWGAATDEWARVKAVVHQRNQMRYDGRSMQEILEHTPSGYAWLDDHRRYGFTKLGDALRRVWHRKTNGTDAGHVAHVTSTNDHAGAHHPETHGRARRLVESFLGPVVAAPYALWDTRLFQGTFNEIRVDAKPDQDNVFVAFLRYIVFSTIGCYLTEPSEQPVVTQKSSADNPSEATDGTTLKVLRPDDSWMCFPGIRRAYLPPTHPPTHPLTALVRKACSLHHTTRALFARPLQRSRSRCLTYQRGASGPKRKGSTTEHSRMRYAGPVRTRRRTRPMHPGLPTVWHGLFTDVLHRAGNAAARARLLRRGTRHAGHVGHGTAHRHPGVIAWRGGDRFGTKLCRLGASG
jgi:hypothetical protein